MRPRHFGPVVARHPADMPLPTNAGHFGRGGALAGGIRGTAFGLDQTLPSVPSTASSSSSAVGFGAVSGRSAASRRTQSVTLRSGGTLAVTPSLAQIDQDKTVKVLGFPRAQMFKVGGKHGNVVTSSKISTVHRGWRVVAIGDKRLAPNKVAEALQDTHKNQRCYSVTFREGDREDNYEECDEISARAAAEDQARLEREAAERNRHLEAEAAEAEADRARVAAEEVARKRQEAEEAAERACRAAERERQLRDVELVERMRREAEEAERKRKHALEEEKSRREELERQRAEQEEHESRRLVQEAERERREEEEREAERRREQEAERVRKQEEAEAVERKRIADEAEKQRMAEEYRLREETRLFEAAEMRRKEAELQEAEQRKAEEKARHEREQEEARDAERKRRERQEAAQRALEEAERKQRYAEEADRKRRQAEELEQQHRELQEAEKRRKEEELERHRREAEEARKRREADEQTEEQRRKEREAVEAERREVAKMELARKAAEATLQKSTGLPPREEVAEPQKALMSALSKPAGAGTAKARRPQGPCDKCDGPHDTDACPHFKKAREKHRDAWDQYGTKGAGGSDTAPVVLRSAQVVSQPGDGSCLFHSLSYGLRNTNAAQLRAEIADFIARSPDAEVAGNPIRDWVLWDSGMDAESYARSMRSGSRWGGAVELAVCAKVRNVAVDVYERGAGGTFTRISSFEAERGGDGRVHLLYGGRVHYDALKI
mmetsp:Transcript_5031/g.14052  ORF Transcript_5031/g.14052 Transcript_5031/m.14052 type:complete len:728 (+) Transcript_5031:83-2266(+)